MKISPITDSRGFTLIEVMVAVAIMLTVITISAAGLNSVMETKSATDRVSNQLSALQTAMAIMQRDIQQMSARPVRNDFGDIESAFTLNIDGMTFTKTGRVDLGELSRPATQRMRYFVQDKQLIRRSWKVLDPSTSNQYTDSVILENINEYRFEVMPAGANGDWADSWPPSTNTGNIVVQQQRTMLPRAVKITLDIASFGTLERWFRGPY